MKEYFTTGIGRLRFLAILEGLSLVLLVCLAVPLKYLFDSPALVKAIGPVHGALFLLFVLATLIVSFAYEWKFTKTTWKVLIASIVPFGTFYIDHKILRHYAH